MFQMLIAAETPNEPTLWEAYSSSTLGEYLLLIFMIGVALAMLGREQRKLALQPIIFLLLSLFLFCLSTLFSGLGMKEIFSFVAELLLFAAVGRTCFLVVVSALQKMLRWSPEKIYLDLSMAAVYALVLIPVLRKAGVNTTQLLTASAVVSAGLAIATKATLDNIIAGIVVHIHHPFAIGEWIQFDDKREHIGKVKEISWRATTVVTLDAIEVIIPNSKLAEMPLTNFMRPNRYSRRSIYFVCPYSVPPARVHEIVLKAIPGSRGVLETPPPSIVTNLFTDRGIEYWVRFFTELLDIRDGVDGGVRDRIWYALHREGISLPPGVHQVELTESSAESRHAAFQQRTELHEKLLRASSLCMGLSESAFTILAKDSRMCRYLPKEVLIRQDEPGSELFIVSAGTVSVSVKKSDGVSVEVTQLGPGDYFGEMSVLLGDPRSTTVTAISECELLAIGKQAFATAFAESPEIMETVSRTISSRRVELDSHLAQESVPQVKADEAKSLMMKIQKYFGIV